MTIFIAVCLGIITLELAVVLAFLIATLISVREAARAFETLAYRVDEEVDQVSNAMKTGWMRALQAAAGIAASFWTGRRDK